MKEYIGERGRCVKEFIFVHCYKGCNGRRHVFGNGIEQGMGSFLEEFTLVILERGWKAR